MEQTRAERQQANDPRICAACGSKGYRKSTKQEVNGVHRRRQCINDECQLRWTTIEIDLQRAQAVVALEKAFIQVWDVLESYSPDMEFRDTLKTPREASDAG